MKEKDWVSGNKFSINTSFGQPNKGLHKALNERFIITIIDEWY